MTAASQGLKLLGKKKKEFKWLQCMGQTGQERRKRNCYIRVSVERGSNVAQHVILQPISL